VCAVALLYVVRAECDASPGACFNRGKTWRLRGEVPFRRLRCKVQQVFSGVLQALREHARMGPGENTCKPPI
jgi:hypothetical protein